MHQLSRRLFLQVSSSATLSTLANTTRSDEIRGNMRGKLLPLIVFFQGGAQSAFEFVTPLTDSPRELRGDDDVVTARNGMPLDARWPKFADIADQTAVIRSLDSGNVNHDARPVVGQPGKHGDRLATGGLPHQLIELPSGFSDLSRLDKNLGMHIGWEKEKARFVPPDIKTDKRINARMSLLHALERNIEGHTALFERNRELAASLLSGNSDAINSPFAYADTNKERYGNHAIGDACALASGFAQSGAGVTVVYNEFERGWDLHREMKEGYANIIPPTDHALRELILDSRRHGFVLLMTSEHGRTPTINNSGGRDHWRTDYAVLAGPGIRQGEVMGRVGKDGNIFDERVEGKQLMATVLKACGVEPDNPADVIRNVLQ